MVGVIHSAGFSQREIQLANRPSKGVETVFTDRSIRAGF
jgi:hypothetical protein